MSKLHPNNSLGAGCQESLAHSESCLQPLKHTVSPLGDQILISYKIAFTQYHYGDPQIRMKAIAIHIAPINTTHSRD
jgi:hypothetical protein